MKSNYFFHLPDAAKNSAVVLNESVKVLAIIRNVSTLKVKSEVNTWGGLANIANNIAAPNTRIMRCAQFITDLISGCGVCSRNKSNIRRAYCQV